MTDIELIRAHLFQLQDTGYRDFQAKLIPGIAPETVIGVRIPTLRSYAKELMYTPACEHFLDALPHSYYDENQLHAILISQERDFAALLRRLEEFLPYIDNWAVCDQITSKVLKREPDALLARIRVWLDSDHCYTVRFAIGMLMLYYLDETYTPEYPAMVAAVRREEYYIRMEIAWYFATALAKRYDEILPYLQEHRLDPWTHNKTIQKAIESYRIRPEQKDELRKLRIRKR